MMMGGMFLLPLLLIGLIAVALGWRPQFIQQSDEPNRETPLEVLKKRYARGDISKQEYEEMRHDLTA
jgi:putative membrane protein